MATLAHNQKGIVLLYSLLIIALITAIALAVSVGVINELRLTSGATDATMAFYAAESGIERGLYLVKVKRNDGSSTLAQAATAVQGLAAMLSNGTGYTDTQTAQQPSTISNRLITQNGYVQSDYYDFENPLTPDPLRVAESLKVQNAGTDPSTWAEVSWIAWDNTGTLANSVTARKLIGPTDLQAGWVINNLNQYSGVTPVGYRVRVKAIFGNLSNVTVTPYTEPNGLGNVVDFPSLIKIQSIGNRGTFKQSLTATIPWKIPVNGLYDYVLFSEGDILKTLILNSPTYSSGAIQVEANLPTPTTCNDCNACVALNWKGFACSPAMTSGTQCTTSTSGGTCRASAENNRWGFTLPLPDTIPQGEGYYVSLRMKYNGAVCTGTDCGRKIAVEVSGQASVLQDPGGNNYFSCTVPETYSLGDPSLPDTDPLRTINLSISPQSGTGASGNQWNAGESIDIDWYQISTYKIFQDCP